MSLSDSRSPVYPMNGRERDVAIPGPGNRLGFEPSHPHRPSARDKRYERFRLALEGGTR
ncbi:MAG: hypothetical protein K1X67_13850 [Fimbriimonadaceae bacterium]|nr:hypothetical protein [Fimbriimonadaceae bacterium]